MTLGCFLPPSITCIYMLLVDFQAHAILTNYLTFLVDINAKDIYNVLM